MAGWLRLLRYRSSRPISAAIPRLLTMHPQLDSVLELDRVLVVRNHPALSGTAWNLVRGGQLRSVFPGVLARADDRSQATQLRAAMAWCAPQGVFHATTAVQCWLESAVSAPLHIAHPTRKPVKAVVIRRRAIPADQLAQVNGLRLVSPAYAGIEVADQDQGCALTELLRARLCDPADILAAVAALRGTPGQQERAKIARACAANPWSFAELRLQQILTAAGIEGWVANRRIRVGDGWLAPDIFFPEAGLILEFDGRSHHDTAAAFVADRQRHNRLVLAGFRILHFTWDDLSNPTALADQVRTALALGFDPQIA